MSLEPLTAKWEAFGWHAQQIDGHNIKEIIDALNKARSEKNKPSVIIADTVKGKGVSFMEDNPGFHGAAPNDEQLELALSELGVKA